MLFAAVALARLGSADAEEQLQKATDGFIGRFSEAEKKLGEDIKSISAAEAEKIWSEN